MNKAFIIGNLTRDPVVTHTGNGIAVCNFTVAVRRRRAAADGEEATDYLPVVAWRGLAEQCGLYIRKGSKVSVLGSIQTRTYEASDGVKRYVTEILADEVEFLTPKADTKQAVEQVVAKEDGVSEGDNGLFALADGLPF